MSARGRQFLRDTDFYGAPSFSFRDFERRQREAARKREEQHRHRVANMSETELAVLVTATAVRDKMAERYHTWSEAGLIGKLLLKRKTMVLPLEHGINASGTRLIMRVRVPADDETSWLLKLSSRALLKCGQSTRLAFADYRYSDLRILQTQHPVHGVEPMPTPHFDVLLARPHIIDRHDPTESEFSQWPTPERTEQLRGILELTLPQL